MNKLLPEVKKTNVESWIYEVNGRFWSLKKNYKKSIAYEKKVIELNKKMGNPYGLGLSASKLANLYLKLNDYENAYEQREVARYYEDSLNSKEKVAELTKLEMQKEKKR